MNEEMREHDETFMEGQRESFIASAMDDFAKVVMRDGYKLIQTQVLHIKGIRMSQRSFMVTVTHKEPGGWE